MFVTHVNGCCVETCANIKLSLFLHVPISLKIITFNIVGHGMDLMVEVLSPCLWTIPICTFMTMNLMMKRPIKITLKSHGFVTLDDIFPSVKKKGSQPTFKFICSRRKNTCSNG